MVFCASASDMICTQHRPRKPPAHTPEVPRRHDAAVYICHARLDEASWLELAAALADFDCSNLTRPLVDILEQVVMNGPQMSEVEIACRHCLEKTLGNELPLRGIQRPEMPDLQLVAKNGEIRRITVVLVIHSAAAIRPRP